MMCDISIFVFIIIPGTQPQHSDPQSHCTTGDYNKPVPSLNLSLSLANISLISEEEIQEKKYQIIPLMKCKNISYQK